MANTVAKKENQSFSISLTTKLNEVTDALPKGFNKARFVQNCIALLNEKKDLQKYNQAQIMQGLLKGAFLGLDFFNKECYLIGYGSELNYQTDYRGEKKLVKKYSVRPVKDIYSEVVREGDDFSIEVINGQRTVTFKPIPFNSKKIVGAFACIQFEDGGFLTETMSLEELENTRKHSKAANSMAWKDFTSEMYRKTVIRRLCKQVELEFESANQQSIYASEVELETDPMVSVSEEIENNANSVVVDIDGEDIIVEG